MKLTQLIKELETIYDQNGDMDVCLNGNVWRQEAFVVKYGQEEDEICCVIKEINYERRFN